MPDETKCPQCGKPVSPDALMGLCPDCLLKAGQASGATSAPGSAQAPPSAPPSPAELARYFPELEILEFIGRGGMGAVYKARQKRLDRLVAVKILPSSVSSDPAFAERFAREARAMARLTHPNIVTIHDFGQTDGLFYFLMEYVDGMNLRQVLNTAKITPKEALAIVPQICDALQYAHDKGIVHRDIKPENILLDKTGVVKIADFGLAKLVGLEAKDLTITSSHDVVGTPHYMAPEQVEHPQDVDHRADIYSLGVVFYQLLTGELPIGRFAAPSRKVQIDVRLDEVVLRALEKEPNLRYQQASQLRTQVETILSTPPPAAGVQGAEQKPEIQPRLSGIAIAGACLAPLFFMSMLFWDFGGAGGLYALFAIIATCLGFVACIGTTILGWKAVSQIRRSAGRLDGLWMAVADGLLYPLLLGDAVMMAAWMLVIKAVNHVFLASRYPQLNDCLFLNLTHTAVVLLLVVATVAWVDYLIVRRAWRAVNRPIDDSQIPPGAPSSHSVRNARIVRGVVASLAALIAVLAVYYFRPIKSDYIGQTYFPKGDSIEIASVRRSKGRMVVRGHYDLVSSDKASLELHITTMGNGPAFTATDPTQQMRITRGKGDFELIHPRLYSGLPHVSMYGTDGHAFAGVYFGTKDEYLRERQLDLGYYQTPTAAAASGATIKMDALIIELPSNVGLTPEYMDLGRLQQRKDVRVISTPVIITDNGQEAEIVVTSGDLAPQGSSAEELKPGEFAAPASGLNLRILPRWDGYKINYKVKIAYTSPGVTQDQQAASVQRSATQTSVAQGSAWPGVTAVFELGPAGNNRRLLATIVFTIGGTNQTPATATTGTTNLGPVVELVVPYDSLIGFDTGKLVTLDATTRAELGENDNAAEMRKEGIDARLTGGSIIWYDVGQVSLTHEDWDTLTPSMLESRLRAGGTWGATSGFLKPQLFIFGFKTRKGTLGILQITDFTDNPRGLKIRYKLAQAAGTPAQAR